MTYPLLDDYLARLPRAPGPERRIWLDEHGHAQGRYFHCTLTSVFQPLHALASGEVVGHEAFIRSVAKDQPGLSVWKLLEGAASDAESIELDRLCRMLHAINFWRQPEAGNAQLYLSVHERLLAAVAGDHGVVYRRVLAGLGLPIARIVLQLPPVGTAPRFLVERVAANYRRNGFRIGLHAANAVEGLRLVEQMDFDALKLDAREIADVDAVEALAEACEARGITLVFRRVERSRVVAVLHGLACLQRIGLAQGRAWGEPDRLLGADRTQTQRARGMRDTRAGGCAHAADV
jgi:EAL domain-containing protein (putative c-di-GMP-specific phosphodiesterase class I)